MTPEIIAHRGASYLAPENTLSAFSKAMEIGADGVEMDVQQTMRQRLVIHHDFVIDWHTDMRGKIYDMTEGELKALDFGSWKDANYRTRGSLPCRRHWLCAGKWRYHRSAGNEGHHRRRPGLCAPRDRGGACSRQMYDRLMVISFNHDAAAAGKAADAGAEGGRAGLRCVGDHGAAH